MSSDELNMLGYFYSTVAQSIAAIIALFGLFATFRIQYSNIQKQDALSSLRNYIKLKCFDPSGIPHAGYRYVNSDVKCWLDKDVPMHLREIIVKGDTVNNSIAGGFYDYYLFINEIEFFTNHLIKRLVQYMAILSILLLINIIALRNLYQEWAFWSNDFVTSGTIALFVGMLFAVIVYTRDSLKGPNYLFINNNETNKSDSDSYSKTEVEKILKEILGNKKIDKRIINKFKSYL